MKKTFCRWASFILAMTLAVAASALTVTVTQQLPLARPAEIFEVRHSGAQVCAGAL